MAFSASVERFKPVPDPDSNQAEIISALEAETLLADLATVFLSNSGQPASGVDNEEAREEQLRTQSQMALASLGIGHASTKGKPKRR